MVEIGVVVLSAACAGAVAEVEASLPAQAYARAARSG